MYEILIPKTKSIFKNSVLRSLGRSVKTVLNGLNVSLYANSMAVLLFPLERILARSMCLSVYFNHPNSQVTKQHEAASKECALLILSKVW
jgi:hypothetical protein